MEQTRVQKIMDRVTIRRPRLIRCTASFIPSGEGRFVHELRTDSTMIVVAREGDLLTLRGTVKAFFEPSGLMEILVEVEGRATVPVDIPDGEVEELKSHIGVSILADASLTVGFLTKAMGFPVILLPPVETRHA